ncbi:11287_t:CDS:2 [Acaulospora colombiana]|uniref:11287_t:CDS:1 n=1 Tax=Acaulospora colombiana TaxID=27376 RepID=A0ACA9L186_9GLOM|nr:11287_t:CDS:2 [Acaulospora colombiana]
MAKYAPLSTSENPSSPPTLAQERRDTKFNYIILFLFLTIGITVLSTIPSIIYLADNESWWESTGSTHQTSSLMEQTNTHLIEFSKTTSHPEPLPTHIGKPPKEMTKPKIVGYFTAWSIYARGYNVYDIDASKLTHINYAFFNLSPDGKVVSGDPWADTDKHFDGDSWNDEGTNLYGNLKQLALLKERYSHLKVLISIGGYTWSTNFGPVTANPVTRKTMVDSLLKLLKDFYIDGIDIDWEYPKNSREGENYVQLVRELRNALDDYAAEIGETTPFLITAALPCGPDNYNKIPLRELARYLDFLNLMAYDFAGSWLPVTGHQSNLYGKDISVDRAVGDYLAAGPLKTQMGLAPRTTESVPALLRPVFTITSICPWEGAVEYFDENYVAGYSYSPDSMEFVTYDTPPVIAKKVGYIKEKRLNGVMFWDLSSDVPTDDPRSLLSAAYNSFGGSQYLDNSSNHRNYPSSVYDNVRHRFGS